MAVKTFQKAELTPQTTKFIKDEITAMHRMNHPNIVKMFEAYESNSAIYLVMEYCKGGDLY